MTDYLELGGLLQSRLESAVTSLKKVAPAVSLAMLEERSATSPAAYVIYDGDTPADQTSRYLDATAKQRWLVVLAIRNQRDTDGGGGVRDEAGPLLAKIIDALRGWYPKDGIRPPRRVTAPRPGYTTGFGYYPLAFEFDLIHRSQ